MELRLANKKDLPYLKIMFKKIIDNMTKNNIKIWNKYYPFEEFKDEIEQERLYLLVQEGDIVSAFVLFENIEGQENFNWKEAKPAVYMGSLGVNVEFLKKGIGTLSLEKAKELSKQRGAKYLRLTAAESNGIAINFYLKNGFKKVDGLYQEYSETLKRTINQIGLEIKL